MWSLGFFQMGLSQFTYLYLVCKCSSITILSWLLVLIWCSSQQELDFCGKIQSQLLQKHFKIFFSNFIILYILTYTYIHMSQTLSSEQCGEQWIGKSLPNLHSLVFDDFLFWFVMHAPFSNGLMRFSNFPSFEVSLVQCSCPVAQSNVIKYEKLSNLFSFYDQSA